MKSAPQVTDGPAGAGPRAAVVIGTRPGSAFGTGTPSTGAAKTSDKPGLSIPNVGLAVVLVGVHGLRLVGVLIVPVAAGLDGGVTNTSKETFWSASQGLRGVVWQDSKLWSGFKLINYHCLYSLSHFHPHAHRPE
jgi:hypothetical protein